MRPARISHCCANGSDRTPAGFRRLRAGSRLRPRFCLRRYPIGSPATVGWPRIRNKTLRLDIEDYLLVLAVTSMNAEYAWVTFGEAHPELEPAIANARNALADIWIAANILFNEQERACHPCSAACRIPCALDTGACFTDPARFASPSDPGPCHMTTARGCGNGVHLPDERCPSACWFTNPELANLPASERCTMTGFATCWEIPLRANEQQRGGRGLNVTTLFCEGRTCSDPMCAP